MAALWWQLSTLQQDALDLSTQAGRRAAEWSEISKSVSEAQSLVTTLCPRHGNKSIFIAVGLEIICGL